MSIEHTTLKTIHVNGIIPHRTDYMLWWICWKQVCENSLKNHLVCSIWKCDLRIVARFFRFEVSFLTTISLSIFHIFHQVSIIQIIKSFIVMMMMVMCADGMHVRIIKCIIWWNDRRKVWIADSLCYPFKVIRKHICSFHVVEPDRIEPSWAELNSSKPNRAKQKRPWARTYQWQTGNHKNLHQSTQNKYTPHIDRFNNWFKSFNAQKAKQPWEIENIEIHSILECVARIVW